jgi:hypothetical protein
VQDKAGVAVVLAATFTASNRMAFDPTTVILGSCRVRLVALQSNGTTAVNQDEQVVIPKFRRF